jgi:ketosteroid isomerase-like protein
MDARGERVIRQAYRAFAERDLDTLIDLADESIEVSTVTGLLLGRTGPYQGYAGLEQYMADIASTWKRIELQPQQFNPLDEERVLVFGRVRAWHERGFLDSSNAWLWTIRGGKVASVQVFADPSEARRAFTDEG